MAANERAKAICSLVMNLAGVLIAYTIGEAALKEPKPIMILWLLVSVAMILAALKTLDLIQAEN